MSLLFLIHLLIEFGPLILFFFVSAIWGFYPGATVLVISTLVALIVSAFHLQRFAIFSFTVSVLTLVSGFATLYLRQPLWLVLEFTVSNLLFALVLYAALRRDRLYLKSMFQHMFLMTDRGWRILTARWCWVFFATGVSNQVYWHYIPDENHWTWFRFVTTFLTVVYALSQFSLSRRERLPEATVWGMRK